jgi:hypothetical protein
LCSSAHARNVAGNVSIHPNLTQTSGTCQARADHVKRGQVESATGNAEYWAARRLRLSGDGRAIVGELDRSPTPSTGCQLVAAGMHVSYKIARAAGCAVDLGTSPATHP